MTHILSVSMPRSGHHLFEVMLGNILQASLVYCEFYGKNCCKSIPCVTKAKTITPGSGVFLQKSHDYGFKDPTLVPDTYRVVQYRSPVPRSLSNYELHLRTGKADTIHNFRDFLVIEARYFEQFYKKWIVGRPATSFLLSYEELTGDPLKAAMEFMRHIGASVDPQQIAAGVAKSVGVRARDSSKSAFVQNDVYAHRYAKYDILANFEDIVLRNCPGYYPTRYFKATNSANSILARLVDAMKAMDAGDLAGAKALAETVQMQEPADPTAKRILRQAAA